MSKFYVGTHKRCSAFNGSECEQSHLWQPKLVSCPQTESWKLILLEVICLEKRSITLMVKQSISSSAQSTDVSLSIGYCNSKQINKFVTLELRWWCERYPQSSKTSARQNIPMMKILKLHTIMR